MRARHHVKLSIFFPFSAEKFENFGIVEITEAHEIMHIFKQWGMKFKIEFDVIIKFGSAQPLDLFSFWAYEGKSSPQWVNLLIH